MMRNVLAWRGRNDWGQVKVTCFEEPGHPAELSLAKSEKQVLAMMKGFFPAGPQAAMEAHAEFRAWVEDGQARGERRYFVGMNTASLPKEPVTEGVRQWHALMRSWENYTVWMDAAGPAIPAEWHAVNGVDFSQVAKLTPEQKLKPKMRMRM